MPAQQTTLIGVQLDAEVSVRDHPRLPINPA